MPAVSAITLGELKPDKVENSSSKKNSEKEKVDKKISAEKEKEKPHAKIPDVKDDKELINPRLVCLLSLIVPGGGHFYLNRDGKGAGFCIAAGAGYTAAGYFMVKTTLAETGSVEYKNYLLLTCFISFISIIIHFVGIIEAYTDAEEINKKILSGEGNPYSTEFIKK